jgi:hypothetical protein
MCVCVCVCIYIYILIIRVPRDSKLTYLIGHDVTEMGLLHQHYSTYLICLMVPFIAKSKVFSIFLLSMVMLINFVKKIY